MRSIAFALCLSTASFAQAEPSYETCEFVTTWARQAMHIAKKIGLAEERWMINEDGFDPDEYAAIIHIKHEAYHDVPALIKRGEAACVKKEQS